MSVMTIHDVEFGQDFDVDVGPHLARWRQQRHREQVGRDDREGTGGVDSFIGFENVSTAGLRLGSIEAGLGREAWLGCLSRNNTFSPRSS